MKLFFPRMYDCFGGRADNRDYAYCVESAVEIFPRSHSS